MNTHLERMETDCESMRSAIKDIGDEVKHLMNHVGLTHADEDFPGQHNEMKANIIIAYRHLEDARMRVGKIMQQIQGGVSKFDKPKEETSC